MRKEEVEGLVLRCESLADKAHASYVFAQQGGGIKLDAELEKAEDFLDVETIIRDYPRMAGFFNAACPLLVGLVLLDHPAPWTQRLVNKEIGDTGEYDGFDQILDANGAVVLERPTDGLPDSEFFSLEDGDYMRLHWYIVGCVNAVASLRAAAREADGQVGLAERIEDERKKEGK